MIDDSPTQVNTVLVVDDHPLIRHGLVQAVQSDCTFTVIATASTGREALQQAELHRPRVVLLDLLLPDVNGVDLIGELRRLLPSVRIVVISALAADPYARRVQAAGAHGFVNKQASADEIVAQLKRSLDFGQTYPPRFPTTHASPGIETLTDRELSIFQLIGRGRSTREIAATLGISFKTVETHRENIKNKLGLHHSLAVVQRATVWVNQG